MKQSKAVNFKLKEEMFFIMTASLLLIGASHKPPARYRGLNLDFI